MSARWYKIFNDAEFIADSVPSRTLVLPLEDRGTETFEIFRGKYTSVNYDDVFLPVNFLEQNPYVSGDYAVYKDAEDYVWFGFAKDPNGDPYEDE